MNVRGAAEGEAEVRSQLQGTPQSRSLKKRLLQKADMEGSPEPCRWDAGPLNTRPGQRTTDQAWREVPRRQLPEQAPAHNSAQDSP